MQAVLKSATAFLGLWQAPLSLESVNKASLAVISSSPGTIEVFGITNDKSRLGQISFNGSVWSSWFELGLANDLLYKSAPSAVSPWTGTSAGFPWTGIFAVVVVDTNNVLQVRHFDQTYWIPRNGWQVISPGIKDVGTIQATGSFWGSGSSAYDIFTRSVSGDIVRFNNYHRTTLSFNRDEIHEFSKAPPVDVVHDQSKMELFYIGSDDKIHHLRRGEWGASTWARLGTVGDETFISPPTPVSIEPGRVDLFGIVPNRTVLYHTYQNGEWTGWKRLGTRRFASAISAIVPQGTNHIELWGLGEDGALWHRGYNGTHWPVDWDSHKGSFISAPALLSPSANVYDVFAIGSDGALKHARRNDTSDTWTPAYRAWESLGGSLHAWE